MINARIGTPLEFLDPNYFFGTLRQHQMLLYKWVAILIYYYQLLLFLQFITTVTVNAVKPHTAAMSTSRPRTTLVSLHPKEYQVPSSYPPELAHGSPSLKSPSIGTSNHLTDVLSNIGNHSTSQYGMNKMSSVDLSTEWYDPCDDGSDFDDPEGTQLLPEDQTMLVHRFSDPLICAVLSQHGVNNKGNVYVPVAAILNNKRPATPSIQCQNKSGAAQASSRFESEVMELMTAQMHH
jgi:hypothetical protein